MCTVRRSSSYRPFAWMATVLALFVFALAPAGWAAVDIVDMGGGTEGDPTDGHDVHRGGGGSDIFDGTTNSSLEPQSYEIDYLWFMPLIYIDGNRVHIQIIWVYRNTPHIELPGGTK